MYDYTYGVDGNFMTTGRVGDGEKWRQKSVDRVVRSARYYVHATTAAVVVGITREGCARVANGFVRERIPFFCRRVTVKVSTTGGRYTHT